jgi:hypothetical protein
MQSKQSADSQPEFFLDRCLGRTTGLRLRNLGWRVHMVSEIYPNDGQEVSDPDWISHGLRLGWSLLTQDKRIRYRSAELGALADGDGTMFCLSSGNLMIQARVDYFEGQREAISTESLNPTQWRSTSCTRTGSSDAGPDGPT